MPSIEKDDVVIRLEIIFQVEGFAASDIYRQIRKEISRVKFFTHWCLVCFCYALEGGSMDCEIVRSLARCNETLCERLPHCLGEKLDNTCVNVGMHAVGGSIQHTGHAIHKPG